VTVPGIRRVAAIYNPESGGGRYRREFPLITGLLESYGLSVEAMQTTEPRQATEFARRAVESGVDAVCAMGGDGTVNEVINGIAETGVPLILIPVGTVNVLAEELGIPLDPADACRVVRDGSLSWIDVGLADDRYFALMAGIGLDAAIVQALNPTLKKVLHEAAFALQGAATVLRGDFPSIRVVSPERTAEGCFAVFGNSANYSGSFGITPMASMRDGLLDVVVLQSLSPLVAAQYWLAALTQSHLRHPKVEFWRTTEARVEVAGGDQQVFVQVDGEVAGTLPLECRIVPGGLKVVVP
jgi:diacylglycerol kinase (ATP)